MLVGSEALGALLVMVLSGLPGVSARAFTSEMTLNIFLRLTPVDLVIVDFDAPDMPADRVARQLRESPTLSGLRFAILALGGHLSADIRARSAAAGIDEVIAKPAAPSYLRERVMRHLVHPESKARPVPPLRPQVALSPVRTSSNVVPLFPRAAGGSPVGPASAG